MVALLMYLCVVSALGAPVAKIKVVKRYPHSTASYTEGFFFRDGLFYEGTGLEGHSAILITDPKTGRVAQHYELPSKYFGEGIVDWGETILEWTWQTHQGFILDRTTLRPISQFTYQGEGWGMTRTDKEIITSDGTSILRFRSPYTFDPIRAIVVRDEGVPVQQLNELEYIPVRGGAGEIYANVWHSDRIARISPVDGKVLGWIDCTGLISEREKVNGESVLNGIAYDAKKDRLFVTGKQWPAIFEIKVIAAAAR